jgi:uncharacterized protein YjbI with pentapeptide repeats
METQTSSSPPQSPEPSQTSKTLVWIGRVVALALILGVVAVIVYGYATRPGWVGVADKQFWDYLELLVVPAVLAGGVAWLSAAQRKRERRAQKAQEERQRVAEEARKQRELAIESQRAQDEALQAYLDQMSQLLIDRDRLLSRARPSDNLSAVARARTLTVLTRLDGVRKGSVLQFLYESGLITKDRPILDVRGSNLHEAILIGAFLRSALLTSANLREADLSGADLDTANLYEANLSDATGWSAEQFIAAESLEGATMPDGQQLKGDHNDGPTFEDWLNSKGSGQDGENGDPS